MSRPYISGGRLAAALVFLLGIVVGTTACGTPGQVGAAPGAGESSSGNITRDEIASLAEGDAFEIVQQLRSLWLRPRIVGTVGGGAVYPEIFRDDLRYGPFRSLRDFRSSEIERIELIGALDATTRYGTGYMGGIIRVVLRR